MIAAGAIAKAWLALVAMTAAQGTLLALLALFVTRFGRPRPAWQASIWLVVIAKLALPWGPAMPWSLSDVIASLSSHAHEIENVAWLPPALRPLEPPPSIWPALAWLALALAWAVGATVVIARAARAHVRIARVARAAVLAPAEAIALVTELATRAGVRTPRLVLGDGRHGPYVIGLWRATIVVPPALLADQVLLRAALLHELAHVRRRDAFARLVQVAAHALVFWWPVVRFAHRRLELAREAACDAYALSAGDVTRPAYARLLVQMAKLRPTGALAAAAQLASPSSLDARVAAVLAPPQRTRFGAVHALALVAWLLLALGGARSAVARGEVCHFTPQLAVALYQAFPEADLDGDGVLSRDEACELQADLAAARRGASDDDHTERLRRFGDELVSRLDPDAQALLSESLCCNCDQAKAYSSPEDASCHSVEGVDNK